MDKLALGLDINVHFTSADAFEFTEALSVFDVCRVRLRHAWVCDPHSETYKVIEKLKGYNKVVEAIIQGDSPGASDEDVCTGKVGLIQDWFAQSSCVIVRLRLHLLALNRL